MYTTFLRALLLATPRVTLGQADYLANAETAAAPLLFKLYNLSSGIWDTTGWWQSSNTMTTLGDLAAIDPNVKDSISAIFANTHVQAPNTHRDFLNDFYDDEGWWALGWINAHDITQEPEYLQTAVEIFDDMTRGWGTPCGGICVAASLANRKPDDRDYYLDWARRSRDWFEKSGLVNAKGVVNDDLDLATCKNAGDTAWSYNQGVILGAYVELAEADANEAHLAAATSIATAAIANLTDANQILHDVCEPNCDVTAAQFEGVFMRNLRILHKAAPRAEFATFINKNADSIWANNRITSGSDTLLGHVWSDPFIPPANATTQSSALDTLVAAASIA